MPALAAIKKGGSGGGPTQTPKAKTGRKGTEEGKRQAEIIISMVIERGRAVGLRPHRKSEKTQHIARIGELGGVDWDQETGLSDQEKRVTAGRFKRRPTGEALIRANLQERTKEGVGRGIGKEERETCFL